MTTMATTAIRLRGESALPGLPEDEVFVLTNPDFMMLQNKLGDSWVSDLHIKLDRYDMKWVDQIVRVACKKVENGKYKSANKTVASFDDLTLSELCQGVLDAVYIACHGKTFEEFVMWQAEKQKEAQERAEREGSKKDENPTTDLGDGSVTSDI